MNFEKVHIITIATGLYTQYLKKFIDDVSKVYTHNNIDFHINVLTNKLEEQVQTSPQIDFFYIEHKKWPFPTLERYKNFLLLEKNIDANDLIIYSDVDMKFLEPIRTNITPYLFGVEHPGYFNKKNKPFIKDKNSQVFLKKKNRGKYICGGVQGGKAKYFFDASRYLAELIEKDIKENRIPKHHDETYWNFYYHRNPDKFNILGPEYCWPEEWSRMGMEGKVLALTKNLETTRTKSLTNSLFTQLGRLKRILRKSKY